MVSALSASKSVPLLPIALPSASTGTPLQPLDIQRRGSARRIWLKLEMRNPSGSIKYRTALGLLRSLDRDRRLVAGETIVESTSGNLGLALAQLVRAIGCSFLGVVDPKLPAALRDQIVAEGARLVHVETPDDHGGYLLTRLAKVADLIADDPNLRWTDQYANRAGPNTIRGTLAEELVEQTGGRVDAALVAVSTGGTLVGLAEGLSTCPTAASVYAVDVRGSMVTADEAHPHLLTGIGATRTSTLLERHHYERALRMRDVEAFAFCRMLERDTGIAVGGSGGAVLAAYSDGMLGDLGRHRVPVAIIADGAERYRSTLYDDAWLDARGALCGVRDVEATARKDGVSFRCPAQPGASHAFAS